MLSPSYVLLLKFLFTRLLALALESIPPGVFQPVLTTPLGPLSFLTFTLQLEWVLDQQRLNNLEGVGNHPV